MIYFDHAAAMRPDPEILDFYRQKLDDSYANQEAGHGAAYCLRRELEQAASEMAQLLTGRPMLVLWAGSGTELFHALSLLPWQGELCCTHFEHPALEAALRRSSGTREFFTDPTGLPPHPRLIAMHHVQSETGQIADFTPFAGRAGDTLLLADTIQSATKLPLPAEPDLFTVSGHKFGAPGGAALLYDPRLKAFEKQFHALRHREYALGRPEPALMLTLAHAVRYRHQHHAADLARVTTINELLRRELPSIRLPGGKHPIMTLPPESASPWILHLLLPGMQSAVVVRMLSERGVYVASGSACQAESDRPSPVLTALGYSRSEAYSGMRLSFSGGNTLDEARDFIRIFAETVKSY